MRWCPSFVAARTNVAAGIIQRKALRTGVSQDPDRE
jgi:hypothetical protein